MCYRSATYDLITYIYLASLRSNESVTHMLRQRVFRLSRNRSDDDYKIISLASI